MGPRADVYGLGGVLYQILTGAPPRVYDSGSMDEILEKIRSGKDTVTLPNRAGLDERLASICKHALEFEPEDRYATAEEFADELRDWLARESG